jgi:hypothetical protein
MDAQISFQTPDPPSAKKQPLIRREFQERLSINLNDRIGLSAIIGAASGLLIGTIKGSQDAGFRFRAENAHRLPTSQRGWFLYHKSKNYNMMLGGVREGFKQAQKFAFWTVLFFVLEEGIDHGRVRIAKEIQRWRRKDSLRLDDNASILASQRDALSSAFAGLGSAGFFSIFSRFPAPTMARTMKMGMKAGLAFGLFQDGLSLLKGRQIGYVEVVKFHVFGMQREDNQREDKEQSLPA